MRRNDLLPLLLAFVVVGCGSVTAETSRDVVEMRDAGPVSPDVGNDSGTDAVAEPTEPDAQADASVSDAQPDDLGDAQPSDHDGSTDAGEEVAPRCGVVSVCYQCPAPAMLCPDRTRGVWLCCTREGLPSCDLTRCTQG